jgi:ubiquinone biosynthesis protein UbiJ
VAEQLARVRAILELLRGDPADTLDEAAGDLAAVDAGVD